MQVQITTWQLLLFLAGSNTWTMSITLVFRIQGDTTCFWARRGGDNKVSRKQIFHNFLNIIAHHIVEICLPSLASYHPRLPRGAGLFAEEAGWIGNVCDFLSGVVRFESRPNTGCPKWGFLSFTVHLDVLLSRVSCYYVNNLLHNSPKQVDVWNILQIVAQLKIFICVLVHIVVGGVSTMLVLYVV